MSTLSAINSVQSQLTNLSTTSTATDTLLSGESFETALDIAMDAKSLILPTPINSAVDIGVDLLEDQGLLSTATNATSIKESFSGVFDELSIGIASSFVAALSGADSATEITPTTDNSVLETTTETASDSTTSSDETSEDGSLFSSQSVSTIKEAFDGVAPYLSNSKAVPITSSALGALEDMLLDDDDEEKS